MAPYFEILNMAPDNQYHTYPIDFITYELWGYTFPNKNSSIQYSNTVRPLVLFIFIFLFEQFIILSKKY